MIKLKFLKIRCKPKIQFNLPCTPTAASAVGARADTSEPNADAVFDTNATITQQRKNELTDGFKLAIQ